MTERRELIKPKDQHVKDDKEHQEINGVTEDLLSFLTLYIARVDDNDRREHHPEDDDRMRILAVEGRVYEFIKRSLKGLRER